jgi:SAM-dependent methyltransferase
MNTGSVQDQLLAEQRAYYRALAADYLDQFPDLPGGAELTGALDAFRPTGSVLDLACGPGTWTPQLLRHASDVTAVDASPEMLALAASRVPDGAPVRFVEADLFTWEPEPEPPAASTQPAELEVSAAKHSGYRAYRGDYYVYADSVE